MSGTVHTVSSATDRNMSHMSVVLEITCVKIQGETQRAKSLLDQTTMAQEERVQASTEESLGQGLRFPQWCIEESMALEAL